MFRLIAAATSILALAAPASALDLGGALNLGSGEDEGLLGVDLDGTLLGNGSLADTSLEVSALGLEVGANVTSAQAGGLLGAELDTSLANTSLDAEVGGGSLVHAALATSLGDTATSIDVGSSLIDSDSTSLLDAQVTATALGSTTRIAAGADLDAGVRLDVDLNEQSSPDSVPCEQACSASKEPAPKEASEKAEPLPEPTPPTPWTKTVEALNEPAVQATLSTSALLAGLWAAVRRHAVIRALAKLASIPMAAGLFSRIQGDKVLDHPVRAAVKDFVAANPGATMQEVRSAVGVAWGTVVHHLRRLELEEHVVSQRDGNHRRFFIRNTMSRSQRKDLATLAAENARNLALAVALRPGQRQKDLCSAVGVSNPVASKYLKRLEENGLVRSATQSRSRLYWPTERLVETIPLLESHGEPLLSSRPSASAESRGRESAARSGTQIACQA